MSIKPLPSSSINNTNSINKNNPPGPISAFPSETGIPFHPMLVTSPSLQSTSGRNLNSFSSSTPSTPNQTQTQTQVPARIFTNFNSPDPPSTSLIHDTRLQIPHNPSSRGESVSPNINRFVATLGKMFVTVNSNKILVIFVFLFFWPPLFEGFISP